jgi:cell division protein FtsB
MKGSLIISAGAVGISIFLVLNLFFGSQGLLSYSRLKEKKGKLTENLTALREINDNLTAKVQALQKNSDMVAGHARNIGYIEEDEWIIQMEGYTLQKNSVSPGSIFEPMTGSERQNNITLVRSLSAAAALLYLFFALVLERRRYGFQ